MTVTDDRYRDPMRDPFSWSRDVVDEPVGASEMRRFSIETGPITNGRNSPAKIICRGEGLAVYARTFADGAGELPVHSHDDESCWLVVSGVANFFDHNAELVATLGAGEGIYVPPTVRYRFTCAGEETLILRIASRYVDPEDSGD
jgi:mannose-6-phosphate isomerase-like protein (cupin superfamily)